MKRFACGAVSGMAAVLGGIAVTFAALAMFWRASLPPPAITPLIQLDLKLRFVRHNSTFDPHILAIGSSIAWRQLDGASFETLSDGPGHFMNGAAANLKIHQTRDLLRFYLENFGNVRTVLVLAGLPDFSDCRDAPAKLFDHDDAAAYAFGHWPASYFYLRYFSPSRYARAVLELARRQLPFTGDLFLDAYGSGPVMVPKSRRRGLRYGHVDIDPACVRTLVELSHELTDRKLRLVVVFPPVNPAYLRSFPETTAQFEAIAGEFEKKTAGDRTQILALFGEPGFASGEFYDAIHLQWPGAVRLSGMIAEAIKEPASQSMVKRGRKDKSNGSAAVIGEPTP